ncbi:MAG: beta-lactamase family protein, partial [Acidobacteria bacterium]|nr:beta-lactamase family protein [Acidobacteriota bacterium]
PKTPGLAVAVVQDGKVIFKKGYGVANLDSKSLITPQTVFNIGSVSKQFTVFMTLLLEREGKLSIDDDVRKYLPELHSFDKTITLRNLIVHTSGLKDAQLLSSMAGWRQGDVYTHEQLLRLVFRQKELDFAPGDQFKYSNTGTLLLSEIIARVSGKPFAEFARERVFEPLGMKSTFIMTDYEKLVENFAYSYYKPNDQYRFAGNPNSVQGFSNVYSTVEDMCLWAMNFSDPIVGDKEIIKKMDTKTVLNSGEIIRFAMGQNYTPYKGLVQIEHTGSHRAYLAYLGRFPEQKTSIVLLSNNEQLKPDLFGKSYEVADVFLSSNYKEPEKIEASKKADPKLIKLTSAQLEKYTGLYWFEQDQYSRKIYVKDGKLMYFRGENNESELGAISATEFKMLNVDDDLRINFAQDERKNKTMSVTVNGDSPAIAEFFEPANYTAKTLIEFTGKYYSEELDATYVVRLEDQKLIARHFRLEDAELSAIKADHFNSNQWYFARVRFVRDAKNQIIGLRASNPRADNVWFAKVDFN